MIVSDIYKCNKKEKEKEKEREPVLALFLFLFLSRRVPLGTLCGETSNPTIFAPNYKAI